MKGEMSVYSHIFPNGKRYIGISCSPEKRWNNGHGYDTQPKMKRAIDYYGWENIRHVILIDGIDYDTAAKIEQLLISAYDSIENGYNVSIGGGSIGGFYLSQYMSGMINAAKYFFPNTMNPLVELAESDRKKPDESGFWNEAADAVTKKHKHFSDTDEAEVAAFWYHIACYVELYCEIASGKDVSKWAEKPICQAVYDYFFKTPQENAVEKIV